MGNLVLVAEGTESFASFAMSWGGFIWAMMGCVLAIVLSGLGSVLGVKSVASSGIGLMTEDPNKFMPCLVLSLLPSTQGIYGFVIAFMMFGNAQAGMTVEAGMSLFLAALPVGIVGLASGIGQGKVAACGISLAAKQPKHWSKAMILALTVEMFALFGFLISIFMLQ